MNDREHLSPAEQAERALDPRKPLVIRLLQWRYVIPFTILSILVMAPLVYRSYLLSKVPDIGDPFDVEAFGMVNLPDADNARIEYERAVALFVQLPLGSQYTAVQELSVALDNDWTHASPAVRQWLEDNRLALEQWKLGTEKPDFLLVHPNDLTPYTVLNLVQAMREFTRLGQLEGVRLLADDQPQEAWLWARAIFRCSRHLGQHGSLMERYVGVAIHSAALDSTLSIAEHHATDALLLVQMLDEGQHMYATTVADSQSVKAEYISLRNVYDNARLLDEMFHDGMVSSAGKPLYKIYRTLGIEPDFSRLVAQQVFANILDQVDLPFLKRQSRVGSRALFVHDPSRTYPPDWLDPLEIDRQLAKTVLARLTIPHISPTDNEACRQRALELCLALRIYRLRHGEYPSDPTALVNDAILDEVPVDPLSPSGEIMRYRITGDEAVVYSIGHDGIDDGGVYIGTDGGDATKDIGLILGRKTDDSVAAQKPDLP